MLSNLVYVSLRKKQCTNNDINDILETSILSNDSKNITGLLLYSDLKFVQYIEGERADIFDLFNKKIKKDERHTDVALAVSMPINKRIFPTWAMASKYISNNDYDYKNNLSQQDYILYQQLLNGDFTTNTVSIMKTLFEL